jgi:hypothetical protein
VGRTFIESLEKVMGETSAALFLATPDDRTSKRGETSFNARDNVILESGMSMGVHGRMRTAIATLDEPKLPSDLGGVRHLVLLQDADPESFKEKNRDAVRDLVRAWVADEQVSPQSMLPQLYTAIFRMLKELKDQKDAALIDTAAAELLESVAKAFDSDTGIAERLIADMPTHLLNCEAILALDVLGPSAWVGPSAYRYLAPQIRKYIRSNVSGRAWKLTVDADLATAMEKALKAVDGLRRDGDNKPLLKESCTAFDNPSDFQWSAGAPRLEFARVLLWTKEELSGHVAESVVAIHEAFHVPLFAVPITADDELRDFDFIAFRKTDRTVTGYYNRREDGFRPGNLSGDGRVPGHGSALAHWTSVLHHERLFFAADLCEALRRGASLR